MANHDLFDERRITFAVRDTSIHLGATLRVCREDRQLICVTGKVTDRGPYVPGRDLDMSKRAMQRLFGITAGVLRVIYREV